MRTIIIALIFLPTIVRAQQQESIFNIDFIGVKTGYSINLSDDPFETLTFTPYIMNMEYIFDQRFPGLGVHGLSMYYVDKGSSIGMTGLFYLTYNLFNLFDPNEERELKVLNTGCTKRMLHKNKQLNLKVGGNGWSSLSQILTDNNEVKISAPTLWSVLEYKQRFHKNLSFTIQAGYSRYWTPVEHNEQDFFEFQVGLNYGLSYIKTKTKKQPVLESTADWKGRFEYQGLMQYMYFNPRKLNDYLVAYGATPREGGISGGGIFTYRFNDHYRLGFLLMGPAGKVQETNPATNVHRHIAYYDFTFVLFRDMMISDRFYINPGISAGIFYLDEIGIVDKTNDTRLVKYAALPAPSLKVMTSLDYFFIDNKEKGYKVGLTVLGGLNYAKNKKGRVVDENKERVDDFPEIDFSGYQFCGGIKIKF